MLILAVVIGLVPLNLLGQSVPLATDRGRIHVASIPDPLGGSNLKVLRTDTNSPLRAGTAWIWEKDRQEEPQTYYASMRAKGLNGVRMILFDAWEVEAYLPSPTFTPTDWKDPVYRARQLARMERSVNYASAHGLYVIINAHNKIPNYNATYCDALWTYVAPYFANRTHVLYEAANEPMDGIGNNGSMTANATDNAANHPRIQALKATFNIIRNAAPLTHVMILTPSGINDYATGTGLGNLAASFASLPGAVDWTKTSVAYHLYNNDSAYGAATNAANLRNLHSRYPAWPSENAFPPGDFPNANGLDEWRSKPFPINGVNDLWVNQTCERLGLGWSMWFMNGQAQLDINWPIMIADANANANAKGWNWTADVLPTTSPVFTSAATAVITQNIAATIQLTATGGNITYAASILPAGLSLNTTTGLISGTTILAGMIPVSISATNSLGTTPATLTLDIRPTQDTTLYSEAFGAGNNAGWFSYSGGSSGLTNSLTNEAAGTTDGRTLKLALIAPNSGGYAGTGIGITGTPPFTNSQKAEFSFVAASKSPPQAPRIYPSSSKPVAAKTLACHSLPRMALGSISPPRFPLSPRTTSTSPPPVGKCYSSQTSASGAPAPAPCDSTISKFSAATTSAIHSSPGEKFTSAPPRTAETERTISTTIMMASRTSSNTPSPSIPHRPVPDFFPSHPFSAKNFAITSPHPPVSVV